MSLSPQAMPQKVTSDKETNRGKLVTALFSGGVIAAFVAGCAFLFTQWVNAAVKEQLDNINALVAKNPNLNISAAISIPFWVYALSVTTFLFIAFVVWAFVFWLYPKHYDKKHNCPDFCNGQILEQDIHVDGVKKLLESAMKLSDKHLEERSLRDNTALAMIESKVITTEPIYIMTSAFLLERLNQEIRQAIISNIVRGVQYKYIIPNDKIIEFQEMLYLVNCDLIEESKNICETIHAISIPKYFVISTICYYPLNAKDDFSEVIIKIPADTHIEATQDIYKSYRIPKGSLSHEARKQYFEHKTILEKLNDIWNLSGKVLCKSQIGSEVGNEESIETDWSFQVVNCDWKYLVSAFPDGVLQDPNNENTLRKAIQKDDGTWEVHKS